MGCLYCGKDIGPIRQIRDSEFCSAVHRKQYGDRLGKALGQIGAPAAAPAGIAGFLSAFPIQTGNHASKPAAGQIPHLHTARTAKAWPVSVSPALGGSFRSASQTALAPNRYSPAPASLDLAPRMLLPPFRFSPPQSQAIPQIPGCLPTPGPQPAERWMALASANEISVAISFRHPGIGDLPLAGAFGSPSQSTALPRIADSLPAPAPQPAECWMALASASQIPVAISFRQPRIGDLPVTSTFVRRIATLAALPEPDPAEREVRAVLDSRPAAYSRPLSVLRFSLHAIDEIASAKPSGAVQAPPPSGARPGLAPMPVESMPAVPAHVPVALPGAAAILPPNIRAIVAQVLPQAHAVAGPAPMPAECMPAARALPAELAVRPPVRLPTLTHFQPAEDSAELLASPVPAAAPAAVESMPSAAIFVARPAPMRPAILAQTFNPEIRARFDVPVVAGPQPAVAAPPSALPQPAMLDPMARIAAQPAGAQPERPVPAIPQPGAFPLEYYCQRITSSPVKRIEPVTPPIALLHQPFAVPAALGPFEDITRKPSRLVLPFEEFFAKRKSQGEKRGRAKINTYGKIAAAVMVGIALWTGSRIANLSRHTEEFKAQVAASERTVAVADSRSADPTQGDFGKGPLGKVRRAIADRAATEITDTFRAGMAAWGAQKQSGEQQSWAPGWKNHPQGYVSTGAMALFQPSLKYTDYRMEFYGQIEEKSLGWVVRAQDKKNYYAMKFTVIEAGLRPIIAMVHYPVVDGKPGHKVETPLSVMVHNNRPIQVAVDVRGSHFTASIDGERIESWSDEASAQGGVGFFSEPGERARLYWMKLSRNQDWLGRFCAYLSDGKARQTAELRAPGFPQNTPGSDFPRLPALALAAAGPFKIRKHRRSERWIY